MDEEAHHGLVIDHIPQQSMARWGPSRGVPHRVKLHDVVHEAGPHLPLAPPHVRGQAISTAECSLEASERLLQATHLRHMPCHWKLTVSARM